MGEAIAVFKNDVAYSKKIIKDRLKDRRRAGAGRNPANLSQLCPAGAVSEPAGIALIKSFLEKSEPQLRPLSVDDQIDGSIVRGLEQSGFFAGLYPAK